MMPHPSTEHAIRRLERNVLLAHAHQERLAASAVPPRRVGRASWRPHILGIGSVVRRLVAAPAHPTAHA